MLAKVKEEEEHEMVLAIFMYLQYIPILAIDLIYDCFVYREILFATRGKIA